MSLKEAKAAREIRQELNNNLPSPDLPPLSSETETMSQTLLLPPLHLTTNSLLSALIKRKESTCSKLGDASCCARGRDASSLKDVVLLGPGGSFWRGEKSLGSDVKPWCIPAAAAQLAFQPSLPCPVPVGTDDAVVLWSTLISPGEAFIAALKH